MNSITRRLQDDLDEQTLALDIARNQVGMRLPIDELLQKLHVAKEDFVKLSQSDLFKKQVKAFVKELEENGVSFQLKARIQAEEMLKKNWQIVHDPDTPATVAVKAIENTVRWGGLEPTKNPTVDVAQGPGFSITINFPDQQQLSAAKEEAERRAEALDADSEEVEDGEIVEEAEEAEEEEEGETNALGHRVFHLNIGDSQEIDDYYDAEDEA